MTTAGPDTLSGRHLLQIIIGRYYTALLYKGVENLVTTSTGTSDYSLTAEKSQYSEVFRARLSGQMALLLYASYVLLVLADFTIGEECNPCEVYSDPTSPVLACGTSTDASLWTHMYQDCENSKSNPNQLKFHLTNLVSFCKSKGLNINVDFNVCPPAKVENGCNTCGDLTAKIGGIKDCAKSLPTMIWSNIIMDCMGYEKRGDIAGRDILMTNVEMLCTAKGKPITLDCPTLPQTTETPPTPTPSSASFTSPQDESVADLTVPPETFPVVIVTEPSEPTCDPCDFSSSKCYQEMSGKIKSAIDKDCDSVDGEDDYNDLLKNLALVCEKKGKKLTSVSRSSVSFTESPVTPPQDESVADLTVPPETFPVVIVTEPSEPTCDPCDFSSSKCYQEMSGKIKSAIDKDCDSVDGEDDYNDLLKNLALVCEKKGKSPIEAKECGN
ncbi:hypothetical protein LSH36_701g01023 [Paralvinella palmiformis]|uniref:Uncharacterized protein n=1 Tax=Paralvinella palmiformis TaxID=53620 RepID=A0AAD9MV97_9ANNE|nr:hypothetical protein LSH36_701g01023 [Paralvinella palmiformis]